VGERACQADAFEDSSPMQLARVRTQAAQSGAVRCLAADACPHEQFVIAPQEDPATAALTMSRPASLPVGARSVVAHGDGRGLLALFGNRAVTAGTAFGNGPLTIVSADDASSVQIVQSMADVSGDVSATAVAVAHAGDVGAVAETSANLVGLISLAEGADLMPTEMMYQGTAQVLAIAFAADGTQV
jgi:hypothetical protein